jgi:hypothetical protein
LVPAWWSCELKIDPKTLTALPQAIEEAMKASQYIDKPDRQKDRHFLHM